METIAFLTMMTIALVVSMVTEILKRWQGLGALGTQAIVFGCGIVIAIIQWGWQFVPVEYAQTILSIVAGAIAWYELVIAKLGK